jgi:hypothetical protein
MSFFLPGTVVTLIIIIIISDGNFNGRFTTTDDQQDYSLNAVKYMAEIAMTSFNGQITMKVRAEIQRLHPGVEHQGKPGNGRFRCQS